MATAEPVAGFQLMGSGPLRTVLADMPATTAPADQLRAMVRCFSAGLDLLPIAAGENITPRQAQCMAHQHSTTLLTQLQKLAGCGQLTILLSAHPKVLPPVADGRSWLHRRAGARKNLLAAQLAIDQILAALPYPHHYTEPRVGTLRCDLLVPRKAAATLCSQIREMDIDGTSHVQLTICGLWPAFHFATLPGKALTDA